MITARRDCQVHELGVRKNEGRSAGLVFLVDILDELQQRGRLERRPLERHRRLDPAAPRTEDPHE